VRLRKARQTVRTQHDDAACAFSPSHQPAPVCNSHQAHVLFLVVGQSQPPSHICWLKRPSRHEVWSSRTSQPEGTQEGPGAAEGAQGCTKEGPGAAEGAQGCTKEGPGAAERAQGCTQEGPGAAEGAQGCTQAGFGQPPISRRHCGRRRAGTATAAAAAPRPLMTARRPGQSVVVVASLVECYSARGGGRNEKKRAPLSGPSAGWKQSSPARTRVCGRRLSGAGGASACAARGMAGEVSSPQAHPPAYIFSSICFRGALAAEGGTPRSGAAGRGRKGSLQGAAAAACRAQHTHGANSGVCLAFRHGARTRKAKHRCAGGAAPPRAARRGRSRDGAKAGPACPRPGPGRARCLGARGTCALMHSSGSAQQTLRTGEHRKNLAPQRAHNGSKLLFRLSKGQQPGGPFT
jgi:hypothetical protein